MPEKDELLRIQEVSAWTGVPVNTLRFWRSQGRGPQAVRIGRALVWRARDVQKWTDEQFAQAG